MINVYSPSSPYYSFTVMLHVLAIFQLAVICALIHRQVDEHRNHIITNSPNYNIHPHMSHLLLRIKMYPLMTHPLITHRCVPSITIASAMRTYFSS